ncbi:MAG: DEAD/DEAH box helicase [Thermoproteota archaeon]|nr:DEAD/DEAH box helicase [Thermoproteota archaeon]
MTTKGCKQKQEILVVSALDLLSANHTICKEPHIAERKIVDELENDSSYPAILNLKFPFELKPDQIKAVEAWLMNQCRGSIIYGSGTGKTEIAFECARNAAGMKGTKRFNILMLVPRIILIEQNYRRLVRYGIQSEKIGRYFGEQKDIREITISTYQSAVANLEIVKRADMVILDEVHLASATARSFSKIFDIISNGSKALLGLTATIDEADPKNQIIVSIIPPARKYLIKDAVADGRLAKPIINPVKVNLTEQEQKTYDEHTRKIRTISARFKRYDADAMMELAKQGGFPSWQAKAWFLNVRKRKGLLASAENKLATAIELIKTKHPNQKVMVFSETLESIRKLKQQLKSKGIEAMLIDSKMPSFKRQQVLSEWGKRFYPLLSVHTLEIGYDVPEVGIEIILATTSNMNQIVQRVGRVLRKVEGKETALVYVIYVSDSKDDNVLKCVKSAIDSAAGETERHQNIELA